MRKNLIASMLVLFTATGGALAQFSGPGYYSPGSSSAHSSDCAPAEGHSRDLSASCETDFCTTKCWASAEYLLWWIKDAPLPFPLVTTGSPATGNPGAPNAGGVPFLTGSGVSYGALSAMRVSAGTWLDDDGALGVEASGFWLPKQTKTYRANSDANGNPVIAFRYQDPPVGGAAPVEDAFQASLPPGNGAGAGPFAGGVAVVSRTELWGGEANGALGLIECRGFHLQALAGFRYVDLTESLSLQLHSTAIDGGTVPFEGGMFGPPSTITSIDSFHTRNQFYGGQLGLRTEFNFCRIFVCGTGKIALGANHEEVNIFGTSTLSNSSLITVSGGQFAGPSNIGRRKHDDFAVIPEVDLKVGYQITNWMRAFVGYDFLYISRVVRPGSQVDEVVDDRTNPVNPGFVPGTNPASVSFPRPLFQQTDFWAQGFTFGLEFRF
jgi:hypothetical protein